MKVALYEHALDQVAIRYAERLKANQVSMSAGELAELVEKNWPKIVAEALTIYHRILAADSEQLPAHLQPAA
ncbi:hypothetical protein SAMN02745165_01373 [Malonomonas rubra DSM 5091]|uniref:Uncharacterized protein n=1 Tax=Malonomonas rubra DSM 5091 TaxID=1122189 RepID=A0A1M6G282_MALRU|nr:hypothetical protein [Malonomonas rubra]SHJ03977.1 hypothetical protein SAMN02745165_01373 [Malonomonas rubra DSM 5091]